MTDQEARDERARIEQSNEVAGIVIDAARQALPDLFVTLDLRYGIADALWAAGYRKHPEPEITDKVVAMVGDMVDPDDCRFDHAGGCQAHGYISLQPGELCPQAEAKAWLASLAVPVGEAE